MERGELKSVLRAAQGGEEVGGIVFLRDPAQALPERVVAAVPAAEVREGWLCIATGGTSGGLKLARHDERTLGAAVAGMRAHFGIDRVNAVDVLPPYHVSGLMARVRAAVSGGEHVAWTWKRLEAGEFPALPARADGWVVSLVPTQLQRLLQRPAAVEWLRAMRVVFIGGGPLWPDLAERAATAGLPLAPSYGMTETAAMVAALRPEEFLAGARTCGTALPHARIATDSAGVVRVAGESVFRGYWPEWRDAREWVTDDIGVLDLRGHLSILGRRDAVIITGGKKVQPEEVEAALRASGEFTEVVVVGVPDPEWGELVVACYPTEGGREPDTIRSAAELAPYQRPKRFLPLADWPRSAQGKVNRAELRAIATAKCSG